MSAAAIYWMAHWAPRAAVWQLRRQGLSRRQAHTCVAFALEQDFVANGIEIIQHLIRPGDKFPERIA